MTNIDNIWLKEEMYIKKYSECKKWDQYNILQIGNYKRALRRKKLKGIEDQIVKKSLGSYNIMNLEKNLDVK